MKLMILMLLGLVSTNVFSEESFEIPLEKFKIQNTENAMVKLEKVLKYPESLLKRFQPQAGSVKITDKVVSQNEISFKASKLWKTVTVKGVLDIQETSGVCSEGSVGYIAKLTLDRSDAIIYENIDRLETTICLLEVDSKNVNGTISGKIFKGNDYSRLVGGFAKGIIAEQMKPLLQAVMEEVKK